MSDTFNQILLRFFYVSKKTFFIYNYILGIIYEVSSSDVNVIIYDDKLALIIDR